jgi:biopolymer transport protein ExbD
MSSLRTRKSLPISLELTPLIDVVFLLLIYFMVSTSFDSLKYLELELPSLTENKEQAQQQSSNIVIGINQAGEYSINEQAMLMDSLEKELKPLLLQKATPVIIAGDANAPHYAVVDLLNVLGGLNATNVQIAATQQQQGSHAGISAKQK